MDEVAEITANAIEERQAALMNVQRLEDIIDDVDLAMPATNSPRKPDAKLHF